MPDRPREPGTFDVDDAVARLLAAYRARDGVSAAPTLDISQLRAVELAIGTRLGSDLLAVFAAHLPALELEQQWQLSRVVGHTGGLHRFGTRGSLVALGHAAEREWYCIETPVSPKVPTRIVVYDAEARKARPAVPLLDWLRATLGDADASGVEPLRPSLAARLLESTAAGVRVRHATFGEGRVLTEQGTGPTRRVKVEFPGIGLKLLQARFLEFLE